MPLAAATTSSTGPGRPTWGWVPGRIPSWPGGAGGIFRPWSDIAASLNAGEAPVAGQETLTPEQIRLETLYLGFRTREGVSLATIREQPRGDAILAELTQAGLVRVDRDRVIATACGLVVADRLPLVCGLTGQPASRSPPLPARRSGP